MAASKPRNRVVQVVDYRRDAADTAALACDDEVELRKLLARRAEARLERDFTTADAILRQLHDMNVHVNDRTGEWRADYIEYNAESRPAARQTSIDPELDFGGSPELARKLGAALLIQWRGDGRRRGQTMTHGFHPTKALMEPLCVSQLLELLPGDGAILDPFAGSGTTMIEAMVSGRAAVGCDLSPLTVGVARQHCWLPPSARLDELRSVVASIVAALEGEEEATPMEGEVLTAAVDFRRAKSVIRAQLDVAGASSAVVAAVWFLLSHEELYRWPKWRKVKIPAVA